MSGKFEIRVGETVAAMGERFIETWRAVERGESVVERHVLSFASVEMLGEILSSPRIDLLRTLAAVPGASVKMLAKASGRDDKGVRRDIEALAEAGLVRKEERGFALAVDGVQASVDFRRPLAAG